MKIILFLGYRRSGKTTAIEHITRALTKKGKKVGTIKHIHEGKFVLDKLGKDTWRHAKAGASQVVAIAPHEFAVFRKHDATSSTLESVMKDFEIREYDYVMVEGLYSTFSGRRDIIRVLCSRSWKDALELLERHREGVAFITGAVAKGGTRGRPKPTAPFGNLPLIRLPGDLTKALSLLKNARGPRRASESGA